MSQLKALAADCLRLSLASKTRDVKSFDAGLAEMIAQLAMHAEDAVEKEEEMHRQDASKGCGV